MRQASLMVAAAIIVIANALALLHVARNRAGSPTAEITLTNRELRHFTPSEGDEDSSVTLVLQWTDPNSLWRPAQVEAPPSWLDRQKLQTLGFDCSVDPESSRAATFYSRQLPRRTYIALEYDGPAWQAWRAWREAYERSTVQAQVPTQPRNSAESRLLGSRLVAIDADLDHNSLRARHPDRGSVLILPAAVAITLDPFPYPNQKVVPPRPARIIGGIQQAHYTISVPRPFSDEFRRLHPTLRAEAETDAVLYRVRLRYGSELEPWVTALEFSEKH
jgi:hypothetical protein